MHATVAGMNFTQVQALMDGFTYKPNMEFAVTTSPVGSARIHVEMWVPDSTRPFRRCSLNYDYDDIRIHGKAAARRIGRGTYIEHQEVIAVTAAFDVPNCLQTEREFKIWLRGCIRHLEDHELDEWFKFNGKVENDPHLADYIPV